MKPCGFEKWFWTRRLQSLARLPSPCGFRESSLARLSIETTVGSTDLAEAIVHTYANEDLGADDRVGTMAADKHFWSLGTRYVRLACSGTMS
jgi:hypothetical protein